MRTSGTVRFAPMDVICSLVILAMFWIIVDAASFVQTVTPLIRLAGYEPDNIRRYLRTHRGTISRWWLPGSVAVYVVLSAIRAIQRQRNRW